MTGINAAMQAAMAATEPTTVEFGGQTYRVLPPMQWRQSAMEAVTVGQFNKWARGVMVNDFKPADGSVKESGSDDAAKFADADLTYGQVLEFFSAYAAAAGQSPGE